MGAFRARPDHHADLAGRLRRHAKHVAERPVRLGRRRRRRSHARQPELDRAPRISALRLRAHQRRRQLLLRCSRETSSTPASRRDTRPSTSCAPASPTSSVRTRSARGGLPGLRQGAAHAGAAAKLGRLLPRRPCRLRLEAERFLDRLLPRRVRRRHPLQGLARRRPGRLQLAIRQCRRRPRTRRHRDRHQGQFNSGDGHNPDRNAVGQREVSRHRARPPRLHGHAELAALRHRRSGLGARPAEDHRHLGLPGRRRSDRHRPNPRATCSAGSPASVSKPSSAVRTGSRGSNTCTTISAASKPPTPRYRPSPASSPPPTSRGRQTIDTVRAGVSYKFTP